MNESMHSRLVVSARWASVLLLLLAFVGGARAECPSVDQAAKAVQQFTKQPVEVRRVVPSAVAGICEAHVNLQVRNLVTYLDGAGTHMFMGPIFEVATNKNITEETIASLNVIPPEDYAKLEALTAATLGDRGATLYLVTGSQDPYLAKAAPALRELAGAGEIQVRVLMYPLPNRKTERDQCVSVICDKKGFEGLENRYHSENICPEGARVVDQSVELVTRNGISGTPSYLLPDGHFVSGYRDAAALRKLLESSVARAKTLPATPPAQ